MTKKLSYYLAGGLGIIVAVLGTIAGTSTQRYNLFMDLLNITSPDDLRHILNIIIVVLLIIIVVIVLLASRNRDDRN